MSAELAVRKKTRQVMVGNVAVGGNAPIVIQSMTNTPTVSVDATLGQIQALADAGCRLVRLAVPDQESVEAFKSICRQTTVPLVADIHFDYKLAIAAIEAGAAKVRINPGNIGSIDRVKAVVDAAKQARIALRIGVNSGSLEKELLKKYGGPTPAALCESALGYVRMMESFLYEDFVLSIKAPDVLTTVNACSILAEQCDYPQHIGITEAGTVRTGAIRSAVGLGILLNKGIGDTLRVSLSGDPVEEVYVAKEILKSLGLAHGVIVIACPTCARTKIDVSKLALSVENMVYQMDTPMTIAVMGCEVNGPGEAREADIGIAGGNGEGVIFMHGKPVERVAEDEMFDKLAEYIKRVAAEKRLQK